MLTHVPEITVGIGRKQPLELSQLPVFIVPLLEYGPVGIMDLVHRIAWLEADAACIDSCFA
ncbi:hypothetical protein D3C71_2011410 [compost metagenome]